MKNTILATITATVFMAAISLNAQTAKVVALSPADTAEAKTLSDQREALQKREKEFEKHITVTYLKASDQDHSNCLGLNGQVKEGWGCGDFQYSEDFKYIVPAKGLQITNGIPGCGSWIVPANGTFTQNVGPLHLKPYQTQ